MLADRPDIGIFLARVIHLRRLDIGLNVVYKRPILLKTTEWACYVDPS
jgi:hypothetical protein